MNKENLKRSRGRPKGVPNKATVEAKIACAKLVDDPKYRAKLRQRLIAGKLHPGVETMLWHYAKGKPKETVELKQTEQLLVRITDDVGDGDADPEG